MSVHIRTVSRFIYGFRLWGGGRAVVALEGYCGLGANRVVPPASAWARKFVGLWVPRNGQAAPRGQVNVCPANNFAPLARVAGPAGPRDPPAAKGAAIRMTRFYICARLCMSCPRIECSARRAASGWGERRLGEGREPALWLAAECWGRLRRPCGWRAGCRNNRLWRG